MLPDSGRDHLGVNLLDLWNSFADKWGHIVECLVTINWISNEDYVLDFWQLRKFGNLIPRLDTVVGNEESMELDARVQTFKLFDLVVGDP